MIRSSIKEKLVSETNSFERAKKEEENSNKDIEKEDQYKNKDYNKVCSPSIEVQIPQVRKTVILVRTTQNYNKGKGRAQEIIKT